VSAGVVSACLVWTCGCCPGGFDAIPVGVSQGAACQPTSASSPAATRIASRNGTNPLRRRWTVVDDDALPRAGWRGGGSVAPGLGSVFTATWLPVVGELNMPERGINFHPWLAIHAFSSDSANSWQLR